MANRIDLEGIERLQKVLIAGGKDVLPAVGRAMHDEALLMFNDSQDEVPVKDGHLQGSGYVEVNVGTGGTLEVEIGYGGPSAPYAAAVHEMPDSTNWTKSGAKPQYLKDPVERRAGDYIRRVVDRVEDTLRRGA